MPWPESPAPGTRTGLWESGHGRIVDRQATTCDSSMLTISTLSLCVFHRQHNHKIWEDTVGYTHLPWVALAIIRPIYIYICTNASKAYIWYTNIIFEGVELETHEFYWILGWECYRTNKLLERQKVCYQPIGSAVMPNPNLPTGCLTCRRASKLCHSSSPAARQSRGRTAMYKRVHPNSSLDLFWLIIYIKGNHVPIIYSERSSVSLLWTCHTWSQKEGCLLRCSQQFWLDHGRVMTHVSLIQLWYGFSHTQGLVPRFQPIHQRNLEATVAILGIFQILWVLGSSMTFGIKPLHFLTVSAGGSSVWNPK